MISDVKQATLVADGRFQNNHAGAGTYIGRARLKGVTGGSLLGHNIQPGLLLQYNHGRESVGGTPSVILLLRL